MTSTPFTLAIDVGKPENIGWASSEYPTTVHGGFDQAISFLAAHLKEEGRATIGFELPSGRREGRTSRTLPRRGEVSRSGLAALGPHRRALA
jgi:hypothetical protein